MTSTPEKRRSTRRARIDKHQAAQAIYIGFESIPGEEPTVLGFASHGVWTAAILDRELADAANWRRSLSRQVALTEPLRKSPPPPAIGQAEHRNIDLV